MQYVTPPKKLHKYLVKKFEDNFDLIFQTIDYHEWRIKELKPIGGKYHEKDIEKFKPIFLQTKELIYMLLREIYEKYHSLFRDMFREDLFFCRHWKHDNFYKINNGFVIIHKKFATTLAIEKFSPNFILEVKSSYYAISYEEDDLTKIQTISLQKECDKIYLYEQKYKNEFKPWVSLNYKQNHDGYIDHNDSFSWFSY